MRSGSQPPMTETRGRAAYQPSQRYLVVDERRVGAEDLPVGNLMGAVLGLEQSRTPEDVMGVVGRLVEWLRGPDDDGLKRAFIDWVWRLVGQFTPGDAEPATVRTLEGVRMTLEERLAEWPKQWFREGHEQGVREGVEHERALLRCLAVSRFGAETAERVSGLLAGIGDPEGLAEVGEWLVRCETGSEFSPAWSGAAPEGVRSDNRAALRAGRVSAMASGMTSATAQPHYRDYRIKIETAAVDMIRFAGRHAQRLATVRMRV